MIRLTRQMTDGLETVRIEGDLNRDVVGLVRSVCDRPAAKAAPQRLLIDLGELRSADQEGLKLLRELMARPEVKLLHCSPIWLTLIEGLPD